MLSFELMEYIPYVPFETVLLATVTFEEEISMENEVPLFLVITMLFETAEFEVASIP